MKTIPSGSSNRFCPILTNTTCTLFFDKTIIVIQVPYISTLYHTVRRLLIVLYILYFYHVHSPNDFCIISPFTATLWDAPFGLLCREWSIPMTRNAQFEFGHAH